MIESNVIEWLDFGDAAQNIDVYSRKSVLRFFKFFSQLMKNNFIPIQIYIIFMVIFFIQLWIMIIKFVPYDGDIIIEILDYLKIVFALFDGIDNKITYRDFFFTNFLIVGIDFVLIVICFLLFRKINLSVFLMLINLLNLIIFYYLLGPIICISLTSTNCEKGIHKYLLSNCYKDPEHLVYFIFSFLMILISIFISFIYSFYCNEIESVTMNLSDSIARVNCNYELYCLISKIIIFVAGYVVQLKGKNRIFRISYEGYTFLNSLIISIYNYNNLYYYNDVINYINFFGWYFTSWFSLCILLKTLLNIECITNLIIIGWVVIFLVFWKAHKLKEFKLITEENIFEFKDVKSIEMYKNIILKKLRDINNSNSKILLYGIIKKFEEFSINNPEVNYQYQKILNNRILKKKINKDEDLPLFAIIYILYSFYLEKASSANKEEIVLHMSYFIINCLNNPTYAMYLCSKLRSSMHKDLYYKYILTEDIKEYLIFKLNKNLNKESIKHIQIGSVILYYLYIYLFKLKIYDAICNQIDYFDLLKNNITTSKTTETFLKSGGIILKSRKEIKIIWDKLIELNPFSDECLKDYMLYLDTIIQDEIVSREESKKYILLKNSKYQEKFNTYHSMFLFDTSCVLLIDGYLSNGKILYASQNFSSLFMYNGKEISNIMLDDLLPSVIQSFHKELVNDAIKYSNVSSIFNRPKESFLKNKIGELYNIRLFIKPVPNLSYGLIYYSYIQKMHETNLVILLDKDLKVSGYTQMSQTDSYFTMNDGLILTQNILGYHICALIPDIISLIEYKNDEYNITKINYEFKGLLYPAEKIKIIKGKIDSILEKIKVNNEEEEEKINNEYNEIIKELNTQKNRPYSIFYKIQLFNFLDGKYKYYRIYVSNDIIADNEHIPIPEFEPPPEKNSNVFKSDISKENNTKKKIIKRFNDKKSKVDTNNPNKNNADNSTKTLNEKNNNNEPGINNKEQNYENQNKEQSNNNINKADNEKDITRLDPDISYESRNNSHLDNLFNKIKNEILNEKEVLALKVLVIVSIVFLSVTILLIVIDFYQKRDAFNRLSMFIMDNLFFNKTKIVSGALYTVGVDIRWASHSLFLNSSSCISGDFPSFYKDLLNEYIGLLKSKKNESSYLGEYFRPSLVRKYRIGLNVYKFNETEDYNFNMDNLITFLINTGIKMIDTYSEYDANNCKIPAELGLPQINIKNLIEIAYYVYKSGANGFSGKEKEKYISKSFNSFPIALVLYLIILLTILLIAGYFNKSMLDIELYFLEKLINFNSTNFDNYIKKIDEIKKKMRNDSNEEEEKVDDMDFNDIDSKKKEEEEGEKNEALGSKTAAEKEEKKKKKKRGGNKQNKIQQQRKKKLKIMKAYFLKINIFFASRIFLVLLMTLSYYLISMIFKNSHKKEILDLDLIQNSINSVFMDSYNILLHLKKTLDDYEVQLIDCKTLGEYKEIRFPEMSDFSLPIIGDIILKLSEMSGFDKFTLEGFKLLFSENACKILNDRSLDNFKEKCDNFWSGVIARGMEQTIIHMDNLINTIIDEIKILSDRTNNITLFEILGQSTFIEYEQFMQYYMMKAFLKSDEIIKDLLFQKITVIISKTKILLIVYLIIAIIAFGGFLYTTYDGKTFVNSFIYFICIFPAKYLSEDENFYKEIIIFGNKQF